MKKLIFKVLILGLLSVAGIKQSVGQNENTGTIYHNNDSTKYQPLDVVHITPDIIKFSNAIPTLIGSSRSRDNFYQNYPMVLIMDDDDLKINDSITVVMPITNNQMNTASKTKIILGEYGDQLVVDVITSNWDSQKEKKLAILTIPISKAHWFWARRVTVLVHADGNVTGKKVVSADIDEDPTKGQ